MSRGRARPVLVCHLLAHEGQPVRQEVRAVANGRRNINGKDEGI